MSDPRPLRRGFSLIELLIVVAIVAILIGMLLPAVQKVRESANAARCRNHLKQLGLAVQSYESAHGRLPPAGSAKLFDGPPYAKGHAWGTYLLLYVERGDLARAYDFKTTFADGGPNQKVIDTPLPVMVCPSAPRRDRYANPGTRDFPLTYTAAPADYTPMHSVNENVYKEAGLNIPAGDPRRPAEDAGMLVPDVPQEGLTPKRSADVSDGLSHTVMLAEAAGRADLWLAGRRQDGHPTYGTPPVVPGGWGDLLGIDSYLANATADGTNGYAGKCLVGCRNDLNFYAFHPAGANAAFGDGSVRLVPSSADPSAVAAAVTARGGEVAGDF